jgi:predicted acylesterase/phospholipase RssA
MYPQQIDHLEALWLALRTKDVFPSSKLRILLNVTRSGFVHRADAWERFLRGHLADACFEDLSLPCAVVAVRLDDGARIVFDSGPILPALMASTAIPGIFPPYRMGDAHFVDGGLVEYMPVPSLIERGATTIYGLDCSHVGADFSETRRIIDRCARIAAQSWVGSATTLPASRGRTIHVLRPELPELANGTDFGRTAELMLMGYRHAREYIRAHELERSIESESSAG